MTTNTTMPPENILFVSGLMLVAAIFGWKAGKSGGRDRSLKKSRRPATIKFKPFRAKAGAPGR